jgi:hypothetical protein
MPQLGRIVPELQHHGIITYREVMFSAWLMIYRVEGDNICAGGDRRPEERGGSVVGAVYIDKE